MDDDVSEWEHDKALKVMRKLLCKVKEASKQGKKRKNSGEHNISKKQAKVRSMPSNCVDLTQIDFFISS